MPEQRPLVTEGRIDLEARHVDDLLRLVGVDRAHGVDDPPARAHAFGGGAKESRWSSGSGSRASEDRDARRARRAPSRERRRAHDRSRSAPSEVTTSAMTMRTVAHRAVSRRRELARTPPITSTAITSPAASSPCRREPRRGRAPARLARADGEPGELRAALWGQIPPRRKRPRVEPLDAAGARDFRVGAVRRAGPGRA